MYCLIRSLQNTCCVDKSSMSLEITWRRTKTETEEGKRWQTKAIEMRTRGFGRRTLEGCEEKCDLLPLCDLLKWLDGQGYSGWRRGQILPFFACQRTAHAWLTLWIPIESIYMRFLLPSHLILKVCQCQSLCLFQISLTSVFWREPMRGFSLAVTVQHLSQTTQRKLSGEHWDSVESVLRCSPLQRSNYPWFESTDIPVSKTDYKLHTVISWWNMPLFFWVFGNTT